MGEVGKLFLGEGGTCVDSSYLQLYGHLEIHVPIFPKEARVGALVGYLIFRLRHKPSAGPMKWCALP